MNQHRHRLALALLGLTLAACGVTPTSRRAPAPTLPAALSAVGAFDAAGLSRTELTVALRKGQGPEELKAYGRRLGFTVSKYWPQIHSAVIRFRPGG